MISGGWGCRLDPLQSPKNEENHFELKPGTIVLEEDLRQKVQTVESDRVVIQGVGAQSPDIEIGSIILSRPTEGAPAGFLRKIIDVEEQGGETIYYTELANLPDAFESYSWNYNTRFNSGPQFRNSESDNIESIDTVFTFELGEIRGLELTMDLELRMDYQLELLSRIDYSFQDGVSSAEIGFDRFLIKELSFTKTFKLGGDLFQGVESYDALQEALEKDILTITLSPFPVDPSSLVWIQPVISLKGILDCMFEAKYSNQINMYHITPGRGIMRYNGMTDMTTIDQQQPDNFVMDLTVGLEGSITIETGLRLEIGLAPYTRNLFTVGVGLENSLINTVSGNIEATLSSEELNSEVAGQLEYRGDVRLSADIFVDGDFFGFIPDALDANIKAYEGIINIIKEGISIENCFTVFRGVSVAAICKGSEETELQFSALTTEQIFQEGGLYDLILTSDTDTLVLGPYDFGTSYTEQISTLPPANYTATFSFLDVAGNFECVRTTSITLPDCNSINDNNCGEDGFVIISDEPYCLYRDYLGREWLASNIRREDRTCYEDLPINCEVYGGLYSYEEALSICPTGWRLPTKQEWQELLELGSADVTIEGNKTIIPGAYFFKDKNYWGIQNIGEPGFNVKPSGYQSPTGGFSHLGRYAYLWTASEANDPENANAMAVIFSDSTNNVIISPNLKTNKMSCRCIKAN